MVATHMRRDDGYLRSPSSTYPPQKRPERPRTVADLDLAGYLQLDRIDHADRVALPVRHDDAPAVRRRRDPFRVIAHSDALDRRQRGEIEHADGAVILVGDEAAALGECDRIGAQARLHAPHLAVIGHVDHGDVVRSDVGGVGAPALGIDGNAKRALPDLDRGPPLARRGIDDGHAVGVAIRGEQEPPV